MAVLRAPTSLPIIDNPGKAPGTSPRSTEVESIHLFIQHLGAASRVSLHFNQVQVHVKAGEAPTRGQVSHSGCEVPGGPERLGRLR